MCTFVVCCQHTVCVWVEQVPAIVPTQSCQHKHGRVHTGYTQCVHTGYTVCTLYTQQSYVETDAVRTNTTLLNLKVRIQSSNKTLTGSEANSSAVSIYLDRTTGLSTINIHCMVNERDSQVELVTCLLHNKLSTWSFSSLTELTDRQPLRNVMCGVSCMAYKSSN